MQIFILFEILLTFVAIIGVMTLGSQVEKKGWDYLKKLFK